MFPSVCPKCGEVVTHLQVQNLPMKTLNETDRMGKVYSCPLCSVVLGVEANPFLLNKDLAAWIEQALDERLPKKN